ncbi:MAG TPA: protein kinase, partial [Nannocystaceae bacterium]|nr:protein kinase [Nannocystaceae bacterium]
VDFGLARLVEPDAEGPAAPRLTSDVEVFGPPAFMAPEQVRRSSDADPRSDVYSVGVVLFALLTGRLPFDGRSAMQVLDRQLHDAPPRPSRLAPHIDAAAEALILRALQKDPELRFAGMDALAEAIAAVPAVPVVAVQTVSGAAIARRAWPFTVGAVALLALAWWAFM